MDEGSKVFKKSSYGLQEAPSSSSSSSTCSSCERSPLFIEASGHFLACKKYGSNVMFERQALENCLFSESLSVDRLFREKKMNSLLASWNRPFVSWNLLKIILSTGLTQRALKDMLNHYKPFEAYPKDLRLDDKSFSKDKILINGLHIPFKVLQGSQVYLDILEAFTLIGKLKIAMTNQWKEVDRILETNNISCEDAFKPRKDKKPVGAKKWYGNRSHIKMDALKYLAEVLVSDEEKKKYLSLLFDHLLNEVNSIVNEKKQIYDEFEAEVLAIQGNKSDLEAIKFEHSDQSENKKGEVIGTEICDSACGRKYHFTIRCCRLNHILTLADKTVGYIVKEDQIFLDKCNAFSALGRMYVIRCSDYRKSDKILESSGLDPKQHYLLERRNYSKSNPRNRRTHISMEAFITLVHMGFADSVKNTSLLQSIKCIVDDAFVLKEKCENYFKVSTTTEEEESEDDLPIHQEESGIESGTSSDGCGSGKNSPSTDVAGGSCDGYDGSDSEDEGILENVNLLFDVVDSNNKSCLNIGDLVVPFQIVNDIVYLDKKTIFQLFKINQSGPYYRVYRVIDKILEDSNVCLDDAFLYEGRKRCYISTKALKVLFEHDFLANSGSKDALVERLNELESQKESLKTNRILNLKSFEPIPFKSCKNTVYVNTLQLMKVVGFSPSYVDNNPSKAYFVVNKLLSQRGINVDSCFLKQGKSKYVFISLHAVILLFQTEFGPFKDKSKLMNEILDSLKEHGLVHEKKTTKRSRSNNITVGCDFPRLKYRIKNDMIYIHRKSLFEHLGLEKVIMSGPKGFEPINVILTNCGLDLNTSYIQSRQEKYSYISLEGVLLILDSQNPLMVCLENRERFYTSLLITIQSSIGSLIMSRGNEVILSNEKIPCKFNRNRLYLLRHTCYSLSGLYDKSSSFKNSEYDIYEYPSAPLKDRGFSTEDCFFSDCGDDYAYISVDALLILMNLDGDLANRSNSGVRHQWENIIAAINVEVPKLKIRVKMEKFRSNLIKYLINCYLECLKNPNKKATNVELIDLVTETEDEDNFEPGSIKKIKVDEFDIIQLPQNSETSLSLSEESNTIAFTSEFTSIKSQILSNSREGMIGDWEVKRIDDELVRLVINPGYGSARKMSFIHPDVAAILSYEFLIQPDLRFAFFINEQQVPSKLLKDIVDSASESVETVGKGLVDCSGNDIDNIESVCSKIVVDSTFIGSSQNGRTYAGTVRSKNCKVLAESRVSDTCSECGNLNKLVINRSVLTDEALRMEESSSSGSSSSKLDDLKTLSSLSHFHQRSVWKIESTNATGCHFATTIVVHKVDISSNLEAKVTLNGSEIRKVFDEFRKKKTNFFCLFIDIAQSSIVRQILHKIWKPIFHEYGMKLSKECPLHFSRDIYKYQELAKLHYRVNLWTCGFCGKSFFKENNLDFHIARSHSHHTLAGDEAVCLADYCDIFRCKGFELDGDNSIFNETNGKSSNSDGNKALVVGPPQELAFLINAGEREINSEAYIGLSGDLDSLLKKRNSELNNEGKETSSKPRDREFTKKRRSSIIEDLDNRAPPNDDDHHESFSNWLFHPEIKEKCDTIMMEDIHRKCQS
ncbi:unnamed protein product [Lepeophtheirus salmonis]|uniref:(salmon louse) hypothetical protein n=1 Tax=Lepeophtheirus salmonis TaxID=72036 RepID=A0A7R8H5Y1_LEPSM|nr:unnamed protein product [Lepeophtheirus salmonis]CAF2875666.1 unnamed protein product [Lepeophtheirus salmonis]